MAPKNREVALSIADLPELTIVAQPEKDKPEEKQEAWEPCDPLPTPTGKRLYTRNESVEGTAAKPAWAKRQSSVDTILSIGKGRSRSRGQSYDLGTGKRKSWIEAYTGRLAKPANDYIRWNLLFTLVIFIFLSSPFWLTAIPFVWQLSMEICIGVCAVLHLFWFAGMFNALRYTRRLLNFRNHEIDLSKASKDVIVKHLVGICIYKEPMQLMIDTIESAARQNGAKEKISLVVGMEMGTPEREEKTKELRQMFASRFERFFITSHPKNLSGDIPGKCSNLNYAMRTVVKILREDPAYPLGKPDKKTQVMITSGDCDTIFGERYFDALEEAYWNTNEKARGYTVWQSPLFYAINLENSPFFVRCTGLMRAFFMMGYLIPWNINTTSIVSLTLDLYEAGGYTHPGYQMEDIIAFIRWSLAIKRQCVIQALPVITLSGPTSGDSYCNEWYEWARQIRRWTIGAAEVFHYFAVKGGALPFHVALAYAAKFIFYHGFVLCLIPIYGIFAPIATPLMLAAYGHPVVGLLFPSQTVFTIVTSSLIGLTYIEMAVVFLVNRLASKAFPDGRRDKTNPLLSFVHWILSYPTIVMYCLVELFAYMEVTVRGKAVCSHSASKKDNLIPTSGNSMQQIHPV